MRLHRQVQKFAYAASLFKLDFIDNFNGFLACVQLKSECLSWWEVALLGGADCIGKQATLQVQKYF